MVINLIIVASLAACSKEEFTYNKEIKSQKLVLALQKEGLTFEGNQLVVNNKAREIKSLDLSGANFTTAATLQRLEVLPNLEELILGNNNFGKSFDFSKLPPNIKSVNLQDNEIFEYKGLVEVNFDNAEIKTLRKFTKLVFPYSARFNVEALPFYMQNNADTDMKMQNKNGDIETYTTLREIPDNTLRKYLKRVFSSKFDGDKLDLLKNFSLKDRTEKMNISTVGGFWGDASLANKKYTTIEGIEYILNDSRYEGDFWALLNEGEEYTAGYIKLGNKCEGMFITGISTPILDLSQAESIYKCSISNNKLLEEIDLSASKKILQRGEKGHQPWFSGDMIAIKNCPKFKKLILPDLSNVSELKTIAFLQLVKLPQLTSSLDFSKIQVCIAIDLAGIYQVPEIIYPDKFAYFTESGTKPKDENKGDLQFRIDKDIYNRASTKAFIQKYYEKLDDNVKSNKIEYFDDERELKIYNYKE